MALIRWHAKKWDPFKELMNLHRHLDHIFDLSFGKGLSSLKEDIWYPATDIYETKEAFIIKAELPGLKQEEIEVSIKEDTLTIKGEKKKEEEIKEEDYHCIERVYGKFERSFDLPQSVDKENIKAAYKDGVLEIVLPKKDKEKPKKISIKIN